ncbi:interleukin-6-like [Xiphias gladius]|uniref:interleukin-6-like n=1 Tax=Xiphias gladius TaxID=8245 RepID=UPI001A99A3C3|nr:interleukin-6-like [Xiphias gladius]
MPAKLNFFLISALMLAARLLCTLGLPVENEPTESPAGDTSGEEEMVPSDLLSASPIWDSILGTTERHQKEFEDEFEKEVKYHFLDYYKISSLPASCPNSNFSKEACFQRLAQGLHTYMVLFKHVEKEYPGSLILAEVRHYSGLLISLIKGKMRNPEQVTVLTGSLEEQLLKDIDNPDTFYRKMTAHSILRHFHDFLRDAKRAIRKRERPRGNTTNIKVIKISYEGLP